jgi:glutathione peroxidase
MAVDRRGVILGGLGSLATGYAVAQTSNRVTAYVFTFTALEGPDIRLADHAGKPMLVVNTASQCGFTPQYAGLQQLHAQFADRGLFVLGVPSNEFNQEPGHGAEIAREAHAQFGVTFALTAPVPLRGANAHPFYKWAALERPLETPRWNFHKYLIGQDGHVAATFVSDIEPEDSRVIAAIERQLVSKSAS